MTKKALRILSAWAILGAIIACSLPDNEDDTPPPPPPGVQPPSVPVPNQPIAPIQPIQPNVPVPNQPNIAQPNVPSNTGPPAIPISIETGFLPDPRTVNGTAGGPRSAGTLSPNCRGYIPQTPQHVVTLTTAFSNLRIISRANGDTTLAVHLPDGTYRCADDDDGFNPIVSGQFPAGPIEIYVGTYSSGTNIPYVLGLTERSSLSAYDLPL